jgi:hypothetical protein
MKNCKWLRRALLGGVAISVMSTGAQADDLGALKAQIEALQSRVNSLESTPSTGALPEGASLITFKRGQGTLADWNVDRASEGQMPSDRGFTIAVTRTADIPAPITEVTVSGYVKGDFIWNFNQSIGDTFTSGTGIDDSKQNDVHFHAHAKQTRFRIKSKTDTAIGQIRTLIEGDFFGGGASYRSLRLRHAYGEWDMIPNGTLGIGRYWRLGYDVFTGVSTVDFGGSVGSGGNARTEQVRLQYSSGPVTFAMGIQTPKQSVRNGVVLKTGGTYLGHAASTSTVIGSSFLGFRCSLPLQSPIKTPQISRALVHICCMMFQAGINFSSVLQFSNIRLIVAATGTTCFLMKAQLVGTCLLVRTLTLQIWQPLQAISVMLMA